MHIGNSTINTKVNLNNNTATASVSSRINLSTKQKVLAAVATVFAAAATIIASITAKGIIATPIGAGIAAGLAALATLVAVAILFIKKTAQVQIPVPTFSQKVIEQGTSVLNQAKAALKTGATKGKEALANAAETVIANPGKTVLGLVTVAATAHVGTMFYKNMVLANQIVAPLATRIGLAAGLTQTQIGQQALNTAAFAVDSAQVARETVGNIASNAKTAIVTGTSKAKIAITAAASNARSNVVSGVRNAKATLTSATSNAKNLVGSVIGSTVEAIQNKVVERQLNRMDAKFVQSNLRNLGILASSISI